MDTPKNIADQILEFFSNDKSSDVDADLKGWLDSSKKNEKSFKQYKRIWNGINILSSAKRYDSYKAWSKVDKKIYRTKTITRRLKNVSYAVSGIAATLLLVIGFAFYSNLFSINQDKLKLTTNYGSRSEVVLPDGSIVKLNAGSSIEYHFNKVTKRRELNFSGEGFFEVAKSNNPFVIHTSHGMNLKVLGTKFNLSAYPEDKIIQTALVEGKVELTNERNEKLILTPGQIAKFDKESKVMGYMKGDLAHVYSWLDQKIYLENTSMSEISLKLERWFDVDITIVPVSMGEEVHYTGVLEEETILDVLNALKELSDIKYIYKGKKITISRK